MTEDDDKELLLSQIDINDEESEILKFPERNEPDFNYRNDLLKLPNNKKSLSHSRTSTKNDLHSSKTTSKSFIINERQSSHDTEHLNSENSHISKKLSSHKQNSHFKLLLLMINFALNGISFGLFMFSRDYFIEHFNIKITTSINIILIQLISALCGIFIANLTRTKSSIFHAQFILSLTSSICLFGIIQVRYLSNALILIGIFGLCMGFSTTIAIKWCLNNNTPKHAQNLRTNILHMLSLIGMILFFCLITRTLTNTNGLLGSNLESITSTTSTTPKVHLKKPQISDGSFLEQSRVTKPPDLKANYNRVQKRQLFVTNSIQNEVTDNSSIPTFSTSTKLHLKKPVVADGSFLEQHHVTKPILLKKPELEKEFDNVYIEKNEILRGCLENLQRNCVLKLSKCELVDAIKTEIKSLENENKKNNRTSLLESALIINKDKRDADKSFESTECKFTYNPSNQTDLKSENIACHFLMNFKNAETNVINKNQLPSCFYEAKNLLRSLLAPNGEVSQTQKCYIGDGNKMKECQKTQRCDYISDSDLQTDHLTKEVQNCLEAEWDRKHPVASTTPKEPTLTKQTTITTTTTDTISTVSSTQMMTTSLLPTLMSENSTNNDFKNNNDNVYKIANDLFNSGKEKFETLMQSGHELERLYGVLALAYLLLAFMHSLFIFKLIKRVFFGFFNTLILLSRLICCIKSESKNTISYNRVLNNDADSNLADIQSIPLLSLKSPYIGPDNEKIISFTCKEVTRNSGLWVILISFFVYGGLLFNFILFLDLFLKEKFENRLDYVFKIFLVSFLIGRGLLIISNGLGHLLCKKKKHESSQHDRLSNLKSTFWKQNYKLYCSTLLIVILSIVQFINITNYEKTEWFITLIYGILYPLFLSVIFPQLFTLLEAYLLQQYTATEMNSIVTLYAWQTSLLGAILLSLLTNYSMFNFFKTTHVFIYSNLIESLFLLVAIVIFSFFATKKKIISKRFISFNELRFNETSKSREDNKNQFNNYSERLQTQLGDSSMDEDEEIVLMIDDKNNKLVSVKPFTD